MTASLQTQRRVAHQLFDLEEANRGYLDGEILSLLRRHLEHVIWDVGKTPWSVQRSRRDLRGRTGRRDPNRRPLHVDGEVQRGLSRHLSVIDAISDDRGEL